MSLLLNSIHLWNKVYTTDAPTIPDGSATIENCDFLTIAGQSKSILVFTPIKNVGLVIKMVSCRFYQCTLTEGQYCISASGYSSLTLQLLCFYLGTPQLLSLNTPAVAEGTLEKCQFYGGTTDLKTGNYVLFLKGKALNPSNLNFSFLTIYCAWGEALGDKESIAAKYVSSSDLTVDFYFIGAKTNTHSFTSCSIFRNQVKKRFVTYVTHELQNVTLDFVQSIFNTTKTNLTTGGELNFNGCYTDLQAGPFISIADSTKITLPISGMDLGDECYRDPTLNAPRFYELQIYYVKAICGYFNLAVFTVIETGIFMIVSHATSYRQ